MREFDYTITDPEGMHARPAGLFVREAKMFESDIIISKDGNEANAKKLLAVMSLGVKTGQQIHISVNGSDEDAAADSLESFLKKSL